MNKEKKLPQNNAKKTSVLTENRRRFNKIKQLANAIWLSCPDTHRLMASDPRDSDAVNELDNDASVSVIFERFSDFDDETFGKLLAMRELADEASIGVTGDLRVRYTFVILDCR